MASEKSRASEVLGGAEHKGSKKKHKVRAIHARRAKGGYIAEHHFEPDPPESGQSTEPTPLPEEHVIPNMDALKQHMEQHLPEQEPEDLPAAA